MILRPPNAAVSEEQALQVYNDDLAGLSPSELASEMLRASRIAARHPRALIWRGMTPITVPAWADERITKGTRIMARLGRPPDPDKGPIRGRPKPWR